jgi:SAM-dependent methyltransferase
MTGAPDDETIALYDARAAEYADTVSEPEPPARLLAFIDALPAGARVLDLGCGPGNAAAAMAAAGLEVDAVDASAGMVAVARARHGITARQGGFADLAPPYHGVWANFSLLHAPRVEMPGHLARLHAALLPGGLLHLGLKTGTGARRDALGRLYTYYAEAEIDALLAAAGFDILSRETGEDTGFDGVPAAWAIRLSRKPGGTP